MHTLKVPLALQVGHLESLSHYGETETCQQDTKTRTHKTKNDVSLTDTPLLPLRIVSR